ncbi:MAG: hypothetical protein E7666_06910 [Ruminococcaceae bacterium]|nr:hypothetical protein [Oscillospiraceae bacterium]
MNDEKAISNDACEEALPQNDPPLAQETETTVVRDESLPQAEISDAVDSEEDPEISADPVQDPDPSAAPHPDSDPKADLDQLRGELKQLQKELADQRNFYQRVEKDYEEFRTLYPDTPISALPDRVWDDVRCGIPIAAAYALAEQRQRRLSEQAESVNRQNSQLSSGALLGTEPEFFTPAEVRAMSREDVRKNYSKIVSSMKQWN